MGVEIRWFFEGSLPPDVSAWFDTKALGEVPPTKEERTDLYLATREDLGVKLRDGKLEIKWRPNPGQPLNVSARGQGQAEYWEKWSWTDPAGKAEAQIAECDPKRLPHPWIPVPKERYQRKYELIADTLRNVASQEKVEQGVLIELTSLIVGGRWWWTLGLDLPGKATNADGSLQEAKEALERPLGRLLESYPGPDLSRKNSYGYPKFLLTIKA